MQAPVEVSPEWITIDLLQQAIRSYRNDDLIEVVDYAVKSGFDEHIASVMYSCRIDLKHPNDASSSETLDVIIKARPVTDGLVNVASEGPLFENEIRMYTETIPAFNKLFRRFGMENIDLGPG